MKIILTLITLLLLHTVPAADTVGSRFKIPNGYKLETVAPGSFGEYLSRLPLKPAGTPTRTYKGDVARTDVYTAAVVNMSVGTQDLQQCADAVIRLRAEYLYHQKRYSDIAFNFTSGFKCDFVHYAAGYRYQNERWVLKAKKDNSYAGFLRYMQLVFSYAGTLSLQKELKPVTNPTDIKAGDVFIRGGSPGHCFIVLEVAGNAAGKKQFLLAQSYMPAQNIQVLQSDGSVWFSMDRRSNIMYADLISAGYLKRFGN